MGVVWHGTYLRYFEDGREAFGRALGMSYLEFYEKGYFIPIVKSEIDHKGVVRYGDEIEITTSIIQGDAAKIVFEYSIFNVTMGMLAATGKTVQVFMKVDTRELYLVVPDFYKDWLSKINAQ
jgi:acyl-CoA thioester hydrolase